MAWHLLDKRGTRNVDVVVNLVVVSSGELLLGIGVFLVLLVF